MKADLVDISFTRDGDTLLTVRTRENVTELFDRLKDLPVRVEVKQWREKRSLDANGYFFVLLDKLAEKLRLPKTELYQHFVKEVGGNTETVCVRNEAVDKLISGWGHNGLGWVSQTAPSKIAGCTNVILYYGSSTFDTAEMSRLIDLVVQECKQQGIETMTPEQLSRLEGYGF